MPTTLHAPSSRLERTTPRRFIPDDPPADVPANAPSDDPLPIGAGSLYTRWYAMNGQRDHRKGAEMAEPTIRSIIGKQNIITLVPETTVRAAAKLMAKYRIGAVPVAERAKLLGIFTERDLMNKVIADGIDTDTTLIRDVMTRSRSAIRWSRRCT
jgi:hypothetical protein